MQPPISVICCPARESLVWRLPMKRLYVQNCPHGKAVSDPHMKPYSPVSVPDIVIEVALGYTK